MDRNRATIKVRCTCCDAVLTVDRSSGEVLFTEKPRKKQVSFEEAVLKLQQEKESAEDRFHDAFKKEEGRRKLTDQKFEEAMKHVDELEEPTRPLDLD
jgi:hypothetical protein